MKLIQRGSKGSDVSKWQIFLINQDFDCGKVDGNFGGRTQTATIDFQKYHKLVADGIVGKLTIQKAETLGFEKQVNYERDVNEIIIHITASNDNATVEDIRKGHLQRGFSDIGYHWLVDREGVIHKGRDESIIGAHCAERNVGTIGISYIARGKDTDQNGEFGKYMTEAQKAGLIKVIKERMKFYGLTKFDVSGHNNYNLGKACPCFNVRKSVEFLDAIS